MTTKVESLLRWVPVAVLLVTVGSASAVGQYQIGQNKDAIKDGRADWKMELAEAESDIEDNADAVEAIQRQLIRRQGEIELDLNSIRNEQGKQGEDLDDILFLLRQIQQQTVTAPRQQ